MKGSEKIARTTTIILSILLITKRLSILLLNFTKKNTMLSRIRNASMLFNLSEVYA